MRSSFERVVIIRVFAIILVIVSGVSVARSAFAETPTPDPRFASGSKLVFTPELRVLVDRMLDGSERFRQQYARLAEASRLVVYAETDPTLTTLTCRARSVIRRYDSGLIIVSMHISPGPNQEEWIAHEFEHVVEELDGLNLRTLMSNRTGGIWRSSEDMVETMRAIRAGREVRDEIHNRPSAKSDKFVE